MAQSIWRNARIENGFVLPLKNRGYTYVDETDILHIDKIRAIELLTKSDIVS